VPVPCLHRPVTQCSSAAHPAFALQVSPAARTQASSEQRSPGTVQSAFPVQLSPDPVRQRRATHWSLLAHSAVAVHAVPVPRTHTSDRQRSPGTVQSALSEHAAPEPGLHVPSTHWETAAHGADALHAALASCMHTLDTHRSPAMQSRSAAQLVPDPGTHATPLQ